MIYGRSRSVFGGLMAGLHAATGARTWNIVAYNFAGYLALRRAACDCITGACNGPRALFAACTAAIRCRQPGELSSLHIIDRAKCAELTRRARDFVTTEASTTSFPRATNATRAVTSRVNAT